MATQENIQKAINLLAVAQDDEMHWAFSHEINSQSDLDNIEIEDAKSFNFTFEDVEIKANELNTTNNTKTNLKSSGKQKLIDLGLTEDEVNIIYGNN